VQRHGQAATAPTLREAADRIAGKFAWNALQLRFYRGNREK
jgi:hypothetical protein